MKTKFYQFCSATLCLLLSLLGFTGCEVDGPVEYGSPSARYKVRGTAVDEYTGKPVEGLRAVLYHVQTYKGEEYITADTLHTNEKGNFYFDMSTYPLDELQLKIEDIDGEANGLYGEKHFSIDLKGVEYKNKSGNWYRGEASVDLGEVRLSEPEEPVSSEE
ncbi:MAG: radical SAM-associated putative lipoprotein [Alistipes sp.]|nr:radical SAM-associated putative lipoprotein [Alistipes sp.]